MENTNTFLIIIQYEDFKAIRKNREISIHKNEYDTDIKPFDRILVATLGQQNIRTVIAEYEIDSVKKETTNYVFRIEPIYIAPPHNGIILNELVYLKLSTYRNVKEWELALERRIVNISKGDFTELATKLAI
ncbi:MAG: hypothetical protein ACXAD7_01795 [Candidatus Kariarchaeaceae archaeon]